MSFRAQDVREDDARFVFGDGRRVREEPQRRIRGSELLRVKMMHASVGKDGSETILVSMLSLTSFPPLFLPSFKATHASISSGCAARRSSPNVPVQDFLLEVILSIPRDASIPNKLLVPLTGSPPWLPTSPAHTTG